MKILFIEPDVVLGRSYVTDLTNAGHIVRTVRTAQAAINAIDDARPDAIVLELQLANHSGIEFLYELRSYQEWQAVPVVILSLVPPAEFRDSWQQLQRELAVITYLYKPHTSLAKLRRTLENLAVTTA